MAQVTPEQWHRVKEVFAEALERDSSQRAAFLDEACDGDVALRREVEFGCVETISVGNGRSHYQLVAFCR